MEYIHVKHDGPDGGKSRMSIGPYSHKAAVDAMKQLKDIHRKMHGKTRVLCIIKIEKEGMT